MRMFFYFLRIDLKHDSDISVRQLVNVMSPHFSSEQYFEHREFHDFGPKILDNSLQRQAAFVNLTIIFISSSPVLQFWLYICVVLALVPHGSFARQSFLYSFMSHCVKSALEHLFR